jgi:hypothetical protein
MVMSAMAQAFAMFQNAGAFVLPSLTEGFPQVLNECMSARRAAGPRWAPSSVRSLLDRAEKLGHIAQNWIAYARPIRK